jgi:outer membrane protein assembly factor BamB
MRSATISLLAAILCAMAPSRAAVQNTPTTPADTGALAVAWRKEVKIDGLPRLAAGASAVFVGTAESGLAAYAATDGRELWSSAQKTDFAPIVVGNKVVGISGTSLGAIHQETGQPAWEAVLGGPDAPARFEAAGELAILTAGRDLRAWRADGSVAWRATMDAAPVTRVVGTGSELYVALETPEIVALDPAVGTIRWRARLPARPTSLTVAGNQLLLGADDGAVYAFRNGPGFRKLWRHRAVDAIGDPAFDEKLAVFALVDNTLKAFSRDGGSLRWSHNLSSRPISGPVVMADAVFVPLANGSLVRVPMSRTTAPPAPPASPNQPGGRLNAAIVALQFQAVFAVVTDANAKSELIAWRAEKK